MRTKFSRNFVHATAVVRLREHIILLYNSGIFIKYVHRMAHDFYVRYTVFQCVPKFWNHHLSCIRKLRSVGLSP